MGVITKSKTWADNENVLYTDLNKDFDDLYNEFNGNIDNANVKNSAGIVEAKILFSNTGHGHTGGSDGKLITISRAFGFFISGTPSVANDLGGWNPTAPQNVTAVKIWAYARTAPTGASLIASIYDVTQARVVGTVTITAAATTGNNTTMTNAAIVAGDVLRADITQIGSTIPGSDISVVVECTQP